MKDYCQNCGKLLINPSTYCTNCGYCFNQIKSLYFVKKELI